MRTTVKMLASGMAMCFVAPAAFAISTEQAATNLQGAAQFSHLARKTYSTALQTERVTGQAMYAAFSQHGVYSPEATAAVQAHSDAIDRIKAARLEDKFGRTQLDAARLALKTATPDAVTTKTPILTTTAGLPKGTLINPQTPRTSSVTYIDHTAKTTTSTEPAAKAKGSAGTVTEINQVNNYYVAQSNNRQVADNSQRIENNSQRIESNSKAIDRNAREIDDTRDELKRGLNNAAAMSSLHYHSDNAWALSTGTANGDGAALAAGIQKGVTSHVAVNMQASSSFDSGWMAGAGISGDF